MEICIITLERYKKSLYSTHKAYCNGLKTSLKSGDLSTHESYDIWMIIKRLELVFNLKTEDTNKYILGFLESDRIQDFELAIIQINLLYPSAWS